MYFLKDVYVFCIFVCKVYVYFICGNVNCVGFWYIVKNKFVKVFYLKVIFCVIF